MHIISPLSMVSVEWASFASKNVIIALFILMAQVECKHITGGRENNACRVLLNTENSFVRMLTVVACE